MIMWPLVVASLLISAFIIYLAWMDEPPKRGDK